MFKKISSIKFENEDVDVFVTDEFNRFKYIKENRNPELVVGTNNHSLKVQNSISKRYQFTLVICNEKMEIIDGQNRVAALRELKMPVYFVIANGYNGNEIHLYNSSAKNWTNYDYANYFSKRKDCKNHSSYERLLSFSDRFRAFQLSTLATLLGGGDSRLQSVFREGHFVIKKDISLLESHFEKIVEMSAIVPYITQREFALAAVRVFNHTDYNHKAMLHAFKNYAHSNFMKGQKEAWYMLKFTEVYNYNRPKRTCLQFHSKKDVEIVAGVKITKETKD